MARDRSCTGCYRLHPVDYFRGFACAVLVLRLSKKEKGVKVSESEIICPRCKKPVADSEGHVTISVRSDGASIRCSSCGAEFSPSKKQSGLENFAIITFLVVVVLVILALLWAGGIFS